MSTAAVVTAEILLVGTALLAIYWFFFRHRRAGAGMATVFKPTDSPENWPSLAREMAAGWLVVTEGPGSGARHMLVEGTNVIGRGSSSNIRLSDPTVSRQHARIVVSEDRFVLHDLHSTSGTLVDGDEVNLAAGAPLRNGAVVRLGATSLVFRKRPE